MTGVAALRQAASLLVDYGVEAACLYLRPVARETDAALSSRFAASSRLLDSGCRAALSQRRAHQDEGPGGAAGCENSAKEGLLLRLLREALGGGGDGHQAASAASDSPPVQQQQQQQQRVAVIGSECVFPALCRVLKHAGWSFISLESASRQAAAAAASAASAAAAAAAASRDYNLQLHGGNIRPGEPMSSLEPNRDDAPDNDSPLDELLEGRRRRPGHLERLLHQGCGAARVVLMTHEQAQELFSSSSAAALGGDNEAAAASEAFPVVIEYAVEPPSLTTQHHHQQPKKDDVNHQRGNDDDDVEASASDGCCGPRRWGAECALDASPIVRITSPDGGHDHLVCDVRENKHRSSSSLLGCLIRPRHMVLTVRAPASVTGAACSARGEGAITEQQHEGIGDEGAQGHEDFGRCLQHEQQVVDETAESLVVGSVAAADASPGGLCHRRDEELRGSPAWGSIRRDAPLQPSSCRGPQLDKALSSREGGDNNRGYSRLLMHERVRIAAPREKKSRKP